MQITLPQKPKVIFKENNKAIFEISELYPGYGVTIGNSLRRILLSSLPGAAITSVKIKGVKHEFSTIDYVLEDVIEILLNIKQIRLKLHSSEPQMITLKVKGEKNVTGADIQTPSQVEVVNKDVHIATITNKKGELEIEMQVESGLGYVASDMLKSEKREVGSLPLDAFFSPIKKVNYEVENMRVGDRTDFNRLKIFIETDGTISPEEALVSSVKILIDNLEIIFKIKDEKEKIVKVGKESGGKELKEEKVSNEEDVSKIKIEDLNFSTRTINALTEGGIKTVGGLIRKNEEDLENLEGLGEKAIKEIKKELGKLGLTLKS